MNFDIEYSQDVIKFIEKNRTVITKEKVRSLLAGAVKKILRIENNNVDLKRLKGELKDYYRIRTGNMRIVFTLKKEESLAVFVYIVDFRKDAYK